MRIGSYISLFIPVGIGMHFGDHAGPVLRNVIAGSSTIVTFLLAIALYQGAQGKGVNCWRLICLAVAIPLLTLAYVHTGGRLSLDRALAFAAAEDHLKGIEYSANSTPAERALWQATRIREYQIAKAEYDFTILSARLSPKSDQSSHSWMFWAALAFAGAFLVGAIAPRTWVTDAWEHLTAR